MLDRSDQIERAMAMRLPAMPRTIPEVVRATTRLGHVAAHRRCAGLERHDRRGELERRARWIGALRSLVVKRNALVGEQRVVVRRRDAADEAIGVDAGRGVNREYVAGSRIDGHSA